MSKFAVAKCKVIAQMLGSPEVAISSVMEVWLSSTRSEKTVRDFRVSVNKVLSSLHGRSENDKIMSYLKHWALAETISAAKARSEFFVNLERYNSKELLALCYFHREIDRLDLTEYMLTGEVRASSNIMNLVEKERGGAVNTAAVTSGNVKSASKKKHNRKKKNSMPNSTPLVGSLTMWNVPPNAPPLEEDVAFNTVDFMCILEDYAERQQNQKHSADRLSVVGLTKPS